MMITRLQTILAVWLIVLVGVASAQQETSHYPAGAEGLKGSSLPGPGTYLKWYNIYYTADSVKDGRGNDIPADLDLNVFATVPRLIIMTDQKILGADYGLDVAVPFLNVDVSVGAAGVKDSRFGLGDVLFEPLVLGWHFESWDVAAAAGIWFPTGDFDSAQAIHLGKGFYTGMFTLGATYYFDDEKSWHLSALGRYETNGVKRDIDVRPGDDFHIEWGLGTNLTPAWTVGVTAYTHWQVTNDSGSAVTWNPNVHDRLVAVGPEIVYFHEAAKMFFSARYQKEFAVRDRTEGHNTVISFVKIF